MGELEGDGLVVAAAGRRLQLHPELVELDGQKVYRHVPVEAFRVGPALHSVLVSQLLVDREEGVQLVVVDVPVLKGTSINHIVDAIEDFVPFTLVLLHRHRIALRERAAASHHGLLSVNPRRDKSGESARNVLTLLAHSVERFDCALGGAADFTADIPTAETLVLAAVILPHFVDYILVVLNLPREVASVPIATRVVETEVELHAIFVGKAEKHVEQVGARTVAPLAYQIFRRISDELTVARANQNHRIDRVNLPTL